MEKRNGIIKIINFNLKYVNYGYGLMGYEFYNR